MDQTVVFEGEVIFRNWFFVENLQYRILVETSDTHWRKVGQPASKAQEGDEVVETHLKFLELQEKMGIDEVKMVDHIAAMLFDNWLGKVINQIRRNKKSYVNVGLLLHPNHLAQ